MSIENENFDLKAFSPALTKSGKPLISTEKTPLADPDNKKKRKIKYKSARDLDDEFAPNKDKPTTADAKKGLLDLPAAMSAVDPQGLSSIAPMMYSMMGKIKASNAGSSQTTRKTTMQEALTGALSLLSNKYTFDNITDVFNKALSNGGIDLIDSEYRKVLINALANLYKNYVAYGEGNLPTSSYETVTQIGTAPTPVVTTVPDLYIKQYYPKDQDPYPGYIHWVSQDGTTSVYTQRTVGDLYYSTATEEVYSIIEQWLAESLEPYIIQNNLTAQILNNLLKEADNKIEKENDEATGGKNSSSQLMSILMQLAGYVGNIVNKQQSVQLPVSVLNKGSIQNSLQKYTKNIGQFKREKEWAKQATTLPSAASTIGNISNLSSSAIQLVNTIKSKG